MSLRANIARAQRPALEHEETTLRRRRTATLAVILGLYALLLAADQVLVDVLLFAGILWLAVAAGEQSRKLDRTRNKLDLIDELDPQEH